MTRSIHRNIKIVRVIDPGSLGATAGGAGKVGKIVDRNGYESLEWAIEVAAVTATNATVTAVVKDGDATGTLAVATAASVLGTLSIVTATTPRASGTSEYVTKRIGYVGPHRYAQLALIPTVSGALNGCAMGILGDPHEMPVASQ